MIADTYTEQPPFLILQSRSRLLVRAGSVAERKARLLPQAGANLTIIAPVMSDFFRTLEQDRAQRIRARFEAHMCEGLHLVIATTGLKSVNESVGSAAEQHGTCCNVEDSANFCLTFFPPIVEHSPATIAVGTRGTPPPRPFTFSGACRIVTLASSRNFTEPSLLALLRIRHFVHKRGKRWDGDFTLIVLVRHNSGAKCLFEHIIARLKPFT